MKIDQSFLHFNLRIFFELCKSPSTITSSAEVDIQQLALVSKHSRPSSASCYVHMYFSCLYQKRWISYPKCPFSLFIRKLLQSIWISLQRCRRGPALPYSLMLEKKWPKIAKLTKRKQSTPLEQRQIMLKGADGGRKSPDSKKMS